MHIVEQQYYYYHMYRRVLVLFPGTIEMNSCYEN